MLIRKGKRPVFVSTPKGSICHLFPVISEGGGNHVFNNIEDFVTYRSQSRVWNQCDPSFPGI